jgi:ribose 5-phosphate isomerase A
MNLKQQAGEKAVEFVKDGMTIGMGTGSTVYWTIRRLGELVREGLKIRIVPTSKQTENLAIEHHISLVTFADVRELDLTIDGADEINPALDLIKGGGGALMREKLVATASKQLIVVADQSKVVSHLGAFPLPVEVVPFGWETTIRRIENLKLSAALRIREGKVFITDNGNYVLDCHCGKIENPTNLHRELKLLTGVVETGLFTGMASIAVIASGDGVRIIEKGAENL